jgi:hypothetical protein
MLWNKFIKLLQKFIIMWEEAMIYKYSDKNDEHTYACRI